jgi:ribosomal protein S18 acetylase RimI-like enzyme
MTHDDDFHYFYRPAGPRRAALAIDFLPVSEFLLDEPACRELWNLIGTQFRTRSKFLAVWSGVRFVAVHRDADGAADGFLLVNAPVNWQIDYVVVRPEARGQGIAAALVTETLNQAYHRGVPYVMLTSKPELRPLYEGSCGFSVVGSPAAEPDSLSLSAAAGA